MERGMTEKMSGKQGGVFIDGKVGELKIRFTERWKRPMATFSVQGVEATVPAIIFPHAYAEYGALLEKGDPLRFSCEVMDDNTYQVMAVSTVD
jgi:hypothetical protein